MACIYTASKKYHEVPVKLDKKIEAIYDFIGSDEHSLKCFEDLAIELFQSDGENVASVNQLFQLCLLHLNICHRKGIVDLDSYYQKYSSLSELLKSYLAEPASPSKCQFEDNPSLQLICILKVLLNKAIASETALHVHRALGEIQGQDEKPLLWSHVEM